MRTKYLVVLGLLLSGQVAAKSLFSTKTDIQKSEFCKKYSCSLQKLVQNTPGYKQYFFNIKGNIFFNVTYKDRDGIVIATLAIDKVNLNKMEGYKNVIDDFFKYFPDGSFNDCLLSAARFKVKNVKTNSDKENYDGRSCIVSHHIEDDSFGLLIVNAAK